jgi:glycosyltransferase involved in cell wall biosynthesis
MKSDGTFIMLSELQRTGVIDDVKVFYESNRGPGFADWGRGVIGHVCPQIKWVEQFIDPYTVIYVRGGFRGWHKLLTDRKGINWLMCYNANTGRERWTFWDIILWDLLEKNDLDRHGRMWYYYKKPIDESVFHPMNQKPFYDICIGASHIHDKKGQWRVISAMIAYERKYKTKLKAIFPGWGTKGTQTSKISRKIADNKLDVTITGMLSREDLNRTVFNRSKLGMFCGTHGQGDRGPLEALATGLPLIVGSRRYHSPSVCNKQVTMIPKDINDIEALADLMHIYLQRLPSRKHVYNYYKATQGFNEVCYPNIKTVFDFIRENREPTLEAKQELVKLCTKQDSDTKSTETSSLN